MKETHCIQHEATAVTLYITIALDTMTREREINKDRADRDDVE
jgi:hypothetical protein